MLDQALIDPLFPADLPTPDHWERAFPPRALAPGARVTRFCPSPTGPMHIGGVYTAMICADLARQSRGTYVVRIEDTDQAREVPGVKEQFDRAFHHFGIVPDESEVAGGAYGPYTQSLRARIYLTYIRDLLRRDRAYLCFATRDELADVSARQQAASVPTGYYGRWAVWRDAPQTEVARALAAGRPYVVRLRADAAPGERVSFVDAIRGRVEFDANRNDIVILKSSDLASPLPTYHFAHAVDDHLMRVTVVIRADEWLPSVPVHLQLFSALGFEPIEYAHVAPLLKSDKGGKRKLSKRKDAEASVEFYSAAGYPPAAIAYYLRGLINGRLAGAGLTAALAAPLHLAECGVSGALVDLVKLDDIAADHVATLPGAQVLSAVVEWAGRYDPELAGVLAVESDLAVRALRIEREGVPNPRKDLRHWSQFRESYGYFFPQLFALVADPGDERLGGVDPAVVARFAADFAAGYAEADDPGEWFAQIRELAVKHSFAATPKEFKAAPTVFHGSIREAAQIIRVALTGSTRSPDLFSVAATLGRDEVVRRVAALAT